MHITVWQMESGRQRSKGASPCFQTAYLAVCGHQEERLWGVGYSWGQWLLHTFLFQVLLMRSVALHRVPQNGHGQQKINSKPRRRQVRAVLGV